jgi:hypothetical protein
MNAIGLHGKIMALSIIGLLLIPLIVGNQLISAASLTNARVTLSDIYETRLELDAAAGSTQIEVFKSDDIVVGDDLFISDGVSSEVVTVAVKNDNTLTVSALVNNYNVSNRNVDVRVVTGITMRPSFNITTTAQIDAVRMTLDANAIADGGSLNGVTSNALNNITSGGVDDNDQVDFFELNADNSILNAGTAVAFDLLDVRIPNGNSSNVYSIEVETRSGGIVVDRVNVFFNVGNAVTVQGLVPPSLTLTIEDDGSKNNTVDDIANAVVFLGPIGFDTIDDDTNGRGVDGNRLLVSTNASSGYMLFIQDNTNGLVNAAFVGAGRPSGDSDDGIDDYNGAGDWPAAGTESYGYSFGATFDSAGIANNYAAFTAAPVLIKNVNTAVSADETFVTIRGQAVVTTPPGTYEDNVIYSLTPGF